MKLDAALREIRQNMARAEKQREAERREDLLARLKALRALLSYGGGDNPAALALQEAVDALEQAWEGGEAQ